MWGEVFVYVCVCEVIYNIQLLVQIWGYDCLYKCHLIVNSLWRFGICGIAQVNSFCDSFFFSNCEMQKPTIKNGVELNLCCSGQGPIAGCLEHGNDPWDSMKSEESLDQAGRKLA
jgi:hypothetical protein